MLGRVYTLQEIATAAGARDLFQGLWPSPAIRHVSFDTRTISHGEQTLFLALQTDKRDGHAFIPQAVEKGVKTFMVERRLSLRDVNYILVDDVIDSLQQWARYHRLQFDYPVIGITGSNGKTIVKEWLTTLLEHHFSIAKSPMSYNSQLGVPLSLLQLTGQADLALIEAGISRPDEMEQLQEIIRPTLGVLTHMGAAHADGFASEEEKLAEKVKLFSGVEEVLMGADQEDVRTFLQQQPLRLRTVGHWPEASLRLRAATPDSQGWNVDLQEAENRYAFRIPLPGQAALENALLVILTARSLGISPTDIADRLPLLHPVEMRTELITDNPEITILNDSYNADLDSVRNAFQMLATIEAQPRRTVILSDLLNQGGSQRDMQQQILKEAIDLFGADQVWTVGPVFKKIHAKRSFATTEDLIQAFEYEQFKGSSLLLKGARPFGLERLIPLLNRRPNATFLQLDLDKLVNNLRLLREQLPPQTKIMGMVKAFSYGSGSWEIAQVLAEEGIEYLAVAYPSEGIELRRKGIELPIAVTHPEASGLAALLQYDLEPVIYNFPLLESFYRVARLQGQPPFRFHLKLDTGMGRLGFLPSDKQRLTEIFARYPDLQLVSILSHLAAADDPEEDNFTRQQVAHFREFCAHFHRILGISPLRHILNTAGATRFPEFAFDMVRLGIGLYGIDPGGRMKGLQEIASLHSMISQVHTYPAGSSVGYGRAQYTQRESRIATVPVGYADGVLRNLGMGKLRCLVHGKPTPTFGRICMDTLMLDVTDIPEAEVGDEVVLFGQQGDSVLSLQEVAEKAGTIAYEIMARISPRVRRIYIRES
jgi:alanine racemase